MAAPARVEPMNATSHHAKVKASLRFADETFVSGEVVAGKMEVECKADKGLAVGVIMVELLAFEELMSRDHSAAQTFLHSRRVFQGPGLPPSNAVHPYPAPGDPLLPRDYFPARRGSTSFLFRINLPESSPPSINFGSGVARVRYEVRAMIGVLWKGEKQLVISKKEINLIERYDPRSLLTRPESVVVSENGKIWVKGEIVGEGVFAGEPACVALTVKNHSTKKNTGLTVTLSRQLVLPNVPPDHPLQIQDTLANVPFRGPEYIINPGVEGLAHLIFDVPDAARTVKAEPRSGGEDEERISPNLFSIKCIVSVTLTMGFGSKDIQLDLPVTVYHPSLLPMATELTRATTPPYNHNGPADVYHPPISPAPYLNLSPSPHNYPLPLTPPPMLPFIDNGRVWIPSPSPVTFQQPYYQPYQSDQHQAFLSPPHISPARPSSAEPITSFPYFAGPSGHSPSSVQQPLPTLAAGNAELALRAEGKGERASRISHHLRMSSRTRSVSPQSHRYAIPYFNSAHQQNVENTLPHPARLDQPSLPFPPLSESPHMQAHSLYTNLSPASASASSHVISPRPMHSPKQTVSVDPFTHASFNKSERVEVLERMAAETVASNADMSGSVPDLPLDLEKTLPKPPVPSGKPRLSRPDERPKAETLFPPSADDDYAPPTPTLAAFSSPKASRVALGQLGGLDALEAKLLAEVGTRKMIQDRRPDVRAVMPIAIPRPGAVPDPAIDSAISSLSLPGIGADEGTLRFDQDSHSGAGSEQAAGVRSNRSPGEDILHGRPSQVDDFEAPKQRVRKKSSPKPKPAEVAKEKEQHRLRKVAQGRVAAWLGSIEPDVPPVTATSPPESPLSTKLEVEVDALVVQDDTNRQLERQETIKALPVEVAPQDDEPNPHSSGFVPLDTIRRNQRKTDGSSPAPDKAFADMQATIDGKRKISEGRIFPDKIFSSRPQDPEVHYDIRSARGGRGGIVTAVAAIWSTAPATEPDSKSPLERAIMQHRAAKQPTRPSPLRGKAGPPPAKSAGWALPPPEPKATAPTSTANLSTKRAKMIKSSSVPAVISSSLATPMLSTTASLARPPPLGDKVRTKVPPVLPGTRSGLEVKLAPTPKAASSPPNDLRFGQARLRELIKKYQG